MKNFKLILIVITFIILIVLGAYFIISHFEGDSVEEEYQDYTPQEEISKEQLRQTMVNLYYEDKETGELMAEVRLIDANLLLRNPYGTLFELLTQNPENDKLEKLIPEGTKINDVSFSSGCVTIDVSKEFLNYNDEQRKFKIVNSIVNTLSELTEVNSVRFLIDGEVNSNFDENYVKTKG